LYQDKGQIKIKVGFKKHWRLPRFARNDTSTGSVFYTRFPIKLGMTQTG